MSKFTLLRNSAKYCFSVLRSFLNLVYPFCCRNCDCLVFKEDLFCSDCRERIQSVVSTTFKITEKYSLKVCAASAYSQPLKSVILKKFYDDMLASKQLARLILEKVEVENLGAHYVVPVPLYWTRYAKRGFNQSKVMSVQIGKSLKVPVLDILRRRRSTAFQSSLKLEEKEKNVKGAFEVKSNQVNKIRELIRDKNILLVDDLCTSGATLKNVARILVDFKPKNVMAVVAARQC